MDVVVETGALTDLDVMASWDGHGDLTLRVVNSGVAVSAPIELVGLEAAEAEQSVLSAPLEATNPATQPDAVSPVTSHVDLSQPVHFPENSVSTLTIRSSVAAAMFA